MKTQALSCAAALFLFALLAPSAHAQTGGPNTFGYEYEMLGANDYVSAASAGATMLGLSDEDIETVTLPWSFSYYGTDYSSVYVGDNGGVRFSSGTVGLDQYSCLAGTSLDVSPDLAIYWADLDPMGNFGNVNAGIYTWHDETGGNDRFIISWEDVPTYSIFGLSTQGATFQIHLHADGAIEYHYEDLTFDLSTDNDAATATIGIQNASGTGGFDELEFSCQATQLALVGDALSFVTCPDEDEDGFEDASCGGEDCDDTDATINPDAFELCDSGVDNDCDPTTDETTVDADSDGEAPCDGDCDDSDPNNFGSNSEVCDGADNNCNSLADFDGDGEVDGDSDGALSCEDCDDDDDTSFPTNVEVCDVDDVDNDCNAATNNASDLDEDGYTTCDTFDDCDDDNATVYPGATELCDGVDTDCNGSADADTAGEVDGDGDGSLSCEDCEDDEAANYPGGAEVCDGIDNDCGQDVDEDFDADTDGVATCGADGEIGTDDDDCNDAEGSIYPGATELCDGVDQDCDGLDDGQDVDTGTGTPTGASAASDLALDLSIGMGATITSTLEITGTTTPITDVNLGFDITHGNSLGLNVKVTSPQGTTVSIHGANFLNTGSNFTDTVIDDESSTSLATASPPFTGTFSPASPLSALDGETALGTWTLTVEDAYFWFEAGALNHWDLDITVQSPDDLDLDGWVNSCEDYGDCDDTAADIYPGAPEICGDGIDQDCDEIDQTGDEDGDTYIDEDCGGDDCDDTDAEVNPSVDEDADGSNFCLDCDDENGNLFPGNLETCGDDVDQDCDGEDLEADEDGDGFDNEDCVGGTDCDDTNALINPDRDGDSDGYHVCEDCNDNLATINPGQEEICDDTYDNDCDGAADNVDEDGDGYSGCTDDCDDTDAAINPSVDVDGDGADMCVDCDDADDTRYPDATEICDDGIDQDCNGVDKPGDADGDTYIDEEVCGGDDCDDDEETAFPGNPEICDGIDNDCDGIDDNAADGDGDGTGACDDCDDNDPNTYPDATEACDGIDNNCDEEIDEGVIHDNDEDSYDRIACGGDDCDDSDADTHPGAIEDCADNADNNCDGLADNDDPLCRFDRSGCSCSSSGAGGTGGPGGGAAAIVGMLLGAGLGRRRRWRA